MKETLTNGIPAPGPCQQEVVLGKNNKKQDVNKQQQLKCSPAQLLGMEVKLKIKDSLTKSYTPSSWALHIMRCGRTE